MESELKLRIRFNETDSMNYVYHGNYASFYHASRTELLRQAHLCDKSLSEQGILLPVVSLDSKFMKAAVYDDLIVVKTRLLKLSACKLDFEHKVFDEIGTLINVGHTCLAFVDLTSRKPIRISDNLRKQLNVLLM